MKNKIAFPAIIFFLILLPFIILFFHSPHFFMTHDGFYHYERTFYYANSLIEGNFPYSWVKNYNFGSGSPIFIFLFPIPYWISSIFYLLGLNLILAVKLTFIFFLITAVLAVYLFLNRSLKLSSEAALVGSLFFAYSPYTLVQIFVRGSLRELAGTAVFPLVLFFLFKNAKELKLSSCGFLGLILGIFFLTDGISVAIFSIFLLSIILWLFFKTKNKIRYLVSTASAFIIGLSIASYILLPYFSERKFLKWNAAYLYQDHFVYFWQYFYPRWGFGFSFPGTWDQMSFQVGYLNILAVIFLVLLLYKKRIKKDLLFSILLANLILIIILITYSPVSLFLWSKIKTLQNIQLAWRFLTVVVLLCSIIAAIVADNLKISRKSLLLLYFLTILLSFKYLRTNQVVIFEKDRLVQNSDDATAFHEFIPIWRDDNSFGGFDQKLEVISGNAVISNEKFSDNLISLNIDAGENSLIRLDSLYFPGWKAYLNNQEIPIVITNNQEKSLAEKRDISGFMQIAVPKGKHEISFKFSDTPLRSSAKKLSIIGLLTVLILIGLNKAERRRRSFGKLRINC